MARSLHRTRGSEYLQRELPQERWTGIARTTRMTLNGVWTAVHFNARSPDRYNSAMRRVILLLLLIVPLHNALAAITEYHRPALTGGAGSPHCGVDIRAAVEEGRSIADCKLLDLDLDGDGDFFDLMTFSITCAFSPVPWKHRAPSIDTAVQQQLNTSFARRPERPQWRLAS